MIAIMASVVLTCSPVVVDGDTLRCGDERIRLLGIDAPEIKGCQAGRVCVEGNPIASRDNLRAAVKGKTLSIERVGKDRYGRTLALVKAGGVDLSCYQVRTGHAVYVAKWDNGKRLARVCGGL
ncbi:MAG: thermonuclease family protein [Asticcacaulis sp.]